MALSAGDGGCGGGGIADRATIADAAATLAMTPIQLFDISLKVLSYILKHHKPPKRHDTAAVE